MYVHIHLYQYTYIHKNKRYSSKITTYTSKLLYLGTTNLIPFNFGVHNAQLIFQPPTILQPLLIGRNGGNTRTFKQPWFEVISINMKKIIPSAGRNTPYPLAAVERNIPRVNLCT